MPAGVVLLGHVAAASLSSIAPVTAAIAAAGSGPRLIAEHGPGMPIPELLRILSPDCCDAS
jgi:hypothetical protein